MRFVLPQATTRPTKDKTSVTIMGVVKAVTVSYIILQHLESKCFYGFIFLYNTLMICKRRDARMTITVVIV